MAVRPGCAQLPLVGFIVALVGQTPDASEARKGGKSDYVLAWPAGKSDALASRHVAVEFRGGARTRCPSASLRLWTLQAVHASTTSRVYGLSHACVSGGVWYFVRWRKAVVHSRG